jgi:hypothetical protein
MRPVSFRHVTERAGLGQGRGSAVERRCRWCQRPLAGRDGPGRPREYCRQSCRQRDYEARERAVERGLDEGEIIMTRANLDALRDRLWVLACAVQDVESDVTRAATVEEYRAALDWLLEAARPLVTEVT